MLISPRLAPAEERLHQRSLPAMAGAKDYEERTSLGCQHGRLVVRPVYCFSIQDGCRTFCVPPDECKNDFSCFLLQKKKYLPHLKTVGEFFLRNRISVNRLYESET